MFRRYLAFSAACAFFLITPALRDAGFPDPLPRFQVSTAHAQAPQPRPRIRGSTRLLTVDSSPQRATVYWSAVRAQVPGEPRDYGVAGYTPIKLRVPRGQVKLIIESPGFKLHEQTIDVNRNQKISFTLEREAQVGKLDLRPGFDQSGTGAEVVIDGVPRGTIPNTFEMVAGRHQVEVKKAGFEDWSQWVELREGEHRTVDVQMKNKAPAEPVKSATVGRLRVLANEQGVEVFLDGRSVGNAPADLEDVIAGQHVVEGKKPGFKLAEESIKLTPGEQLLVRLKLEPAPEEKPKGMLSVKSAVPGAEVFLDGASLGSAPVDRTDLAPGRHFVLVRKKGFRDFQREVVLEERKPVSVIAELAAVSQWKFLSNPSGAQVMIDGEPIAGVTPNKRDEVPAGEHQVVFRLNGFVDNKQIVTAEGGADRIIQADLEPTREGPTPDEVYQAKMGASSLGAKALPKGSFMADAGMGYPYILEARLLVSTLNAGSLKLDTGVMMKSYIQMWEFGLQSRAEFAKFGPLYLGGRAMLGGGAGFNGRNNFTGEVGPVATLSFGNRVNVSVNSFYQYYNDRLCPSMETSASRGIEPRSECLGNEDQVWGRSGDFPDPRETRFSGHRLFLGGSLEVAVNRYMSVWMRLDFVLVPFESRKAFKDGANAIMFQRDSFAYGGAGVSLKL